MADCESLNGCIFFNDKMSIDSGLGVLYKKNYCQGDNSKCARYMVAKKIGKEKVPQDLFPNMVERAKKLIQQDHPEVRMAV